MNKVAVGIVVYNPDIERLKDCIRSVEKNVERIFIYDNNDDYEEKLSILNSKNIFIIREGNNYGIAHALNSIFSKAEAEGFSWVLTLDQDSIIPDGLIEAYNTSISNNSQVGILCPQVIDKRRAYLKAPTSETIEEVEETITSGSCTSIDAWKKVGGFDEWLFIDLVDNDFCMKIGLYKYKILLLKNWVLDQQFGNIEPKSAKSRKIWLTLGKLFHNDNIAKLSYKKHVDPRRVYYTNRNIIYVNRKFKLFGRVGYQNYNCRSYFGFIFCFILPSIIRSEDKKATVKATFQGIKDGLRKEVDPFSI